ncbi:hypothetical protein [Rhizobium sp. SYY.PMSO]|uniref:hypothetical protein n=1 Tax=Rhizobium sp. SYY.PMSO TaxID=3382192 RepID=UPI003990288A
MKVFLTRPLRKLPYDRLVHNLDMEPGNARPWKGFAKLPRSEFTDGSRIVLVGKSDKGPQSGGVIKTKGRRFRKQNDAGDLGHAGEEWKLSSTGIGMAV